MVEGLIGECIVAGMPTRYLRCCEHRVPDLLVKLTSYTQICSIARPPVPFLFPLMLHDLIKLLKEWLSLLIQVSQDLVQGGIIVQREDGVLDQRERKYWKEHDECNQTHMIRILILWVLRGVKYTIANSRHGRGNKVKLVNVEVESFLHSFTICFQRDPTAGPSTLKDVDTGR